jgi:hypothetical protein
LCVYDVYRSCGDFAQEEKSKKIYRNPDAELAELALHWAKTFKATTTAVAVHIIHDFGRQ